MDNVRVLTSPWEKDFIQLLKDTDRRVQLASPFIKSSVAKLIIKNVPSNVKIDYLNSFKLASFHRGASDLEALNVLRKRGARLKSHHQLHAKVFIFDNKKAIVTSGNLTRGGLVNNYEYGLLIEDRKLTDRIAEDYRNIFTDKEMTNSITKGVLEKADAILALVPREKRPRIPVKGKELFEEAEVTDRFEGGVEPVLSTLKGWTRDVFNALNEMELGVFKLSDVYAFERRLKKLHPGNKHVKDKIRQQLQVLRDLGLIQFMGGGVYQRLWIS